MMVSRLVDRNQILRVGAMPPKPHESPPHVHGFHELLPGVDAHWIIVDIQRDERAVVGEGGRERENGLVVEAAGGEVEALEAAILPDAHRHRRPPPHAHHVPTHVKRLEPGVHCQLLREMREPLLSNVVPGDVEYLEGGVAPQHVPQGPHACLADGVLGQVEPRHGCILFHTLSHRARARVAESVGPQREDLEPFSPLFPLCIQERAHRRAAARAAAADCVGGEVQVFEWDLVVCVEAVEQSRCGRRADVVGGYVEQRERRERSENVNELVHEGCA
mmetsp:Transcript_40710/g.129890  ORF Transcript_40710/g.129890 Transcript_40710/m.129890 type:complete len:276 (+) Transcript_40710:271-1098(+)